MLSGLCCWCYHTTTSTLSSSHADGPLWELIWLLSPKMCFIITPQLHPMCFHQPEYVTYAFSSMHCFSTAINWMIFRQCQLRQTVSHQFHLFISRYFCTFISSWIRAPTRPAAVGFTLSANWCIRCNIYPGWVQQTVWHYFCLVAIDVLRASPTCYSFI